MMNTDQRIRQQIGDLVIQIVVLQGQVETLTARNAELEPKPPVTPEQKPDGE